MPSAIAVENVGKSFNRFHNQKPSTIMEAALSGFRKMQSVEDFWALRHLSFAVAPGEMIGVVGHNGAGKSTLLQLLGGVTVPNEGKLTINGRIGALLDLGAGFHGDLTGRENLYVTATVAGLTHAEVADRFDQIVDFAQLEAFIDNPVRTYSTGMTMRLAFAIAVHTEPDVLLVDEFLSVGDAAFQRRCLDRITALKHQGCAIVLVSHDPQQVMKLCDRALWLQQGETVAYGEPDIVVKRYITAMQQASQHRSETMSGDRELQMDENRFGSLEVEITQVRLQPEATLISGSSLTVEIGFVAHQAFKALSCGVNLTTEDGKTFLTTSTLERGLTIPVSQRTGSVKLQIDRLDLGAGQYFVDVGIFDSTWDYIYDFHWHVYPIQVETQAPEASLLSPPLEWTIKSPNIGANDVDMMSGKALPNKH